MLYISLSTCYISICQHVQTHSLFNPDEANAAAHAALNFNTCGADDCSTKFLKSYPELRIPLMFFVSIRQQVLHTVGLVSGTCHPWHMSPQSIRAKEQKIKCRQY